MASQISADITSRWQQRTTSLSLSENNRGRKSEQGRGGCRKRRWQRLRQRLHVSEMCGRYCTVGAVRYVPADHSLWPQRRNSGIVKNHGFHHDIVFALTFHIRHLDCCASTAKMPVGSVGLWCKESICKCNARNQDLSGYLDCILFWPAVSCCPPSLSYVGELHVTIIAECVATEPLSSDSGVCFSEARKWSCVILAEPD